MVSSLLIAVIALAVLLIVIGLVFISRKMLKSHMYSRRGLALVCSSLVVMFPVQFLLILISVPRGSLINISNAIVEFEKTLSQEVVGQLVGQNLVFMNAISVLSTITFSLSLAFSVVASVNILLLIRILRRDYNPTLIQLNSINYSNETLLAFNSQSICRLNI